MWKVKGRRERWKRLKKPINLSPEKKIVKLKSVLTGLIDEFPNRRVRDVARVSGFVISLTVVLGPIA